jgi:membrane associated rhomboid family serine protease
MTAVRSTARHGEAEEWALVLAATGIPHRVEASGEGWTLRVAEEDVARARAALEAFDADEATRARPPAPDDDRPTPWFLGVVAGALLLAAFSVTGTPRTGSPWFDRGAAVAGLMRTEPWRAVIALTLHLDVAHVVGNAVATAVLLPPIGQRLGSGVALFLVVLAGGAGNLAAAWGHAPGHAAVGASTATFAAIGMLGALRICPRPGERTRWKPWTIPAAALVLLAMLGAGRGADVLAHATGFFSGALAGLAACRIRRPLGPAVQWPLGILIVAGIVAGWLRALG